MDVTIHEKLGSIALFKQYTHEGWFAMDIYFKNENKDNKVTIFFDCKDLDDVIKIFKDLVNELEEIKKYTKQTD